MKPSIIQNKYVVHDDYLPSWKIPSFSKYMGSNGFSFTDTLNTYIRYRKVSICVEEEDLRNWHKEKVHGEAKFLIIDSLNGCFFRSLGKDPDKIWDDMYSTISEVSHHILIGNEKEKT